MEADMAVKIGNKWFNEKDEMISALLKEHMTDDCMGENDGDKLFGLHMDSHCLEFTYRSTRGTDVKFYFRFE